MDIITKIATAVNWQELAALIAIISTIVGGLFALAARAIKFVRAKKLKKAIQSQLGRSLKEKPIIFKELNIDPSAARLFCVTFKPNMKQSLNFDESWVDDVTFEIECGTWGFNVHKSQIKDKLKEVDYPYKFYLKVKNDPAEKQKYYARLLDAECTVTGRGDIFPNDSAYWRIWFVINNEPYHPDIDDLMRLNHTLVNRLLVKQEMTLPNPL
jgi:hypothetical protein